MQIKVAKSRDGNWYHNYIGVIFDVESNSSGNGFTLIDTPHNESIFKKESDSERRVELLRRMRNTKGGFRLGVMGENAIKFTGDRNKDYKVLLSEEW